MVLVAGEMSGVHLEADIWRSQMNDDSKSLSQEPRWLEVFLRCMKLLGWIWLQVTEHLLKGAEVISMLIIVDKRNETTMTGLG